MYDSHVSWFASLPILGFPRQLKNPKGLPNHHFPIPCLKFPCSESWYVQFFYSFLLYKSLITYFISYHWLSPSLFGQNPQKSPRNSPCFRWNPEPENCSPGEAENLVLQLQSAANKGSRGSVARPALVAWWPTERWCCFFEGKLMDNLWNIYPVYLPTFGWFLG